MAIWKGKNNPIRRGQPLTMGQLPTETSVLGAHPPSVPGSRVCYHLKRGLKMKPPETNSKTTPLKIGNPPNHSYTIHGTIAYLPIHEWLMFMVNVGKYTKNPWILWEMNCFNFGSRKGYVKALGLIFRGKLAGFVSGRVPRYARVDQVLIFPWLDFMNKITPIVVEGCNV